MGRRVDTISHAAMDTPVRYNCPGNVRELQNVIERSVVLTQDGVLKPAMPELGSPPPVGKPRSDIGSAAEREKILLALRDAKGIVGGLNGAAALLGLKRTTLQARMKKLGIARDYQ